MADGKKKILICEDEKAIGHALELKLGHEGFEVKTVMDGEECLDAVSKDSYDLLLLDLVIPKKDGFAVLAALKQGGITVPVVIISNLGQEEDIKKVQEFGVANYLIKSNTSIAEMVEKVKEVFTDAPASVPIANQ